MGRIRQMISNTASKEKRTESTLSVIIKPINPTTLKK